jgi:hypothetical protein
MNKSESIKELAGALSKAQGEIKGALKDADNPFFKSKYADLASVVEAIRAPLAKHGIAYVQLTVPSEKEEVQVETVLMHESGEWVSGIIAVPVSKADAQGYGSALTYARRYGLAAAVGVAPEDDDGNAAAKAAPRAASKITPNSGAGDDLTNPQKSRCMDVSIVVKDFLAEGKEWNAFEELEHAQLDMGEKLYIWSLFNSKERSAIKRMQEAQRKNDVRKEAAATT